MPALTREGGGGLTLLASPRLTTNQYLAGFALVSVTNREPWFAVPSNAVVHAPWTRYGLAEDTFWLPATNWGFILGTNAVDGLELRRRAFGRLDPGVPDTYCDGLTAGEEVLIYGTDPLSLDILGDGTNDFWRAVDPGSRTKVSAHRPPEPKANRDSGLGRALVPPLNSHTSGGVERHAHDASRTSSPLK